MMIDLGPVPSAAEELLDSSEEDASGAGINYAGAYIRVFKKTLRDGRKVECRRRGLKLTLSIGGKQGEALLRRLEHGPDPRAILHQALTEAAAAADATFSVVDGTVRLEVE